MRTHLKNYTIVGLTCFIACFIDQYSKQSVLQMIVSNGALEVTSFLNFIIVWNKGVSFGLFSGYNWSPNIFIIIAIVIIVFVLWLLKAYNPVIQGLIIGGALGNMIDRALFGAVFDFIDIHAFGWHYPTFNIADSFIVCSAIAIILQEVLPLLHVKKRNKI
ncbi:signal peptidase II [Candidatus Bandiella euplotis]|uniref:Lipoprotein signal peptidase n=1 Tax=Candidatus Bandiella euplotis TaxID=1664265 RepID=A0ABZ0UIG6_9RICK|nr:signal peptidase II [Candidatus Bandiella woodruffii]WPX95905.1 Lipoprotein signal peptidase [Candidatus Bandiella woodruffii]